ncbi:MAG: glucoamylase family protein [Eubacteriales bacterium]|nr:glucoamylase family protein [Eubacteriales bacterium]
MYTVSSRYKDDILSEDALQRRMRLLALEEETGDKARLRVPREARAAMRALRRVLSHTQERERCHALQKAAQTAGFFEPAFYAAAPRERGELPELMGEARIQRIAREILLCSGMQPDAARVRLALRAFAQERGLRMEELMRTGEALRVESMRLYAQACAEAVSIQKERDAAARWLRGEGSARPGSVFLEQALCLAKESGAPRRQKELERMLGAQEGGEHAVLQRERMRRELLCRRMDALSEALRLSGQLAPEELLGLCEAGRLLLAHSCYTSCAEASQAILRRCVAQIAREAELSEAAVVREALDLAARAPEGELRAQPGWYWTEDDGRAELLRELGRADVRLTKRVPDPHGSFYMTAVFALAAALLAALCACSVPFWAWGFAAVGCWALASALVNALCARFVPPAGLLRLAPEALPKELHTLVVIPAILPDARRAEALAGQLEVLAAGERDERFSFCLLGDFPDADAPLLAGDSETLARARGAVARANERIGQRRLYFLHRSRVWNSASGRWMGRERKRGALQALNALLLGGENTFDADGEDAPALAGRFQYVITLDADTRPYPGALRMLVGTIAHPVNRLSGRNVLQPRMALSAAGEPSPFARLLGGAAGVNGYGGTASEVYQDLCGQGGFAGKGVYDVAAFAQRAGQALPENAILSHDLLEGFLVGSAFAGDIVLLDHFPAALHSLLKRTHRWTRGDWQLLPFLRGRTPLQKYRMLDNLRISLTPAAALGLLLAGLLHAAPALLLTGLLVCLSGFLLCPTADGLLRATAQLALLPNEAHCRLDAAARALCRTFISRRNMLEWVSAADAERQAGRAPLWPRAAAALLCALCAFSGKMYLSGAVLTALFLLGAPLLEHMQEQREPERLSAGQRAFLSSLAQDTWRFFVQYTCASGLPPDNVQFEPPIGTARRTSPTNIGLYMACCVGAKELGLIDEAEMLARLRQTAQSLERMEKWHGMPYNWIDPEDGAPLYPRYVSSVDCGNLLACLLLCEEAVRERDPALRAQLRALAEEMELAALYDPVRKLFSIGYDEQLGALTPSYYDLIASEARILSYTAIMLGKAPPEHWQRLSRSCAAAGGRAVPISWSGTMFEYLMPELFFHAPRHTLLHEGCLGCVRAQLSHRPGGFWGVSESGYYAFDEERNFQYRAFGLRALMCKDEQDAPVVSPYSSALALDLAPAEAAENLMRLHAAGFTCPCGLVEAIDFSTDGPNGRGCGVVCSAMAHHQGMLLLACANALTDHAVRDHFTRRPDAQALLPLLEETPAARSERIRRDAPQQVLAERARPSAR